MPANLNFVRQQGFVHASAASCDTQFPALMWQPRAILVLVLVGLLLETGWYFVVFGAVLWWNALFPARNVFDLAYNRLIAPRRGVPPLPPAPAPRRFSQALGGSLLLAVGLTTLVGRLLLAWRLYGLLVLALVLLVFGRFCVGSYLFLLLTGRGTLANRTLPWSRGE